MTKPDDLVPDSSFPPELLAWEQNPYTIALQQSTADALSKLMAQEPSAKAKQQLETLEALTASLRQTTQERDALRRALTEQMRIAVQLSERLAEVQDRIRGQA